MRMGELMHANRRNLLVLFIVALAALLRPAPAHARGIGFINVEIDNVPPGTPADTYPKDVNIQVSCQSNPGEIQESATGTLGRVVNGSGPGNTSRVASWSIGTNSPYPSRPIILTCKAIVNGQVFPSKGLFQCRAGAGIASCDANNQNNAIGTSAIADYRSLPGTASGGDSSGQCKFEKIAVTGTLSITDGRSPLDGANLACGVPPGAAAPTVTKLSAGSYKLDISYCRNTAADPGYDFSCSASKGGVSDTAGLHVQKGARADMTLRLIPPASWTVQVQDNASRGLAGLAPVCGIAPAQANAPVITDLGQGNYRFDLAKPAYPLTLACNVFLGTADLAKWHQPDSILRAIAPGDVPPTLTFKLAPVVAVDDGIVRWTVYVHSLSGAMLAAADVQPFCGLAANVGGATMPGSMQAAGVWSFQAPSAPQQSAVTITCQLKTDATKWVTNNLTQTFSRQQTKALDFSVVPVPQALIKDPDKQRSFHFKLYFFQRIGSAYSYVDPDFPATRTKMIFHNAVVDPATYSVMKNRVPESGPGVPCKISNDQPGMATGARAYYAYNLWFTPSQMRFTDTTVSPDGSPDPGTFSFAWIASKGGKSAGVSINSLPINDLDHFADPICVLLQ